MGNVETDSEYKDDNNAGSSLDIDDLDDVELHIIAQKVMDMLRRDAIADRERRGLHDGWPGWRQS